MEKNKNLYYSVSYIKKFLKNNNNALLITNRQSGKTRALLELLNEDESCYILTFSYDSKEEIIQQYKKMFKDCGYFRIFHYAEVDKKKIKDCYIDEYFFHPVFYNSFRGVISSMRFPVKIKKFNFVVNEEKLKNILTKE